MYFHVAEQLDKNEFMETYRNISFFCQLLVAPLGFPEDALEIFGGEEQAVERIAALYRMWEDVLSRSIYSSRGRLSQS